MHVTLKPSSVYCSIGCNYTVIRVTYRALKHKRVVGVGSEHVVEVVALAVLALHRLASDLPRSRRRACLLWVQSTSVSTAKQRTYAVFVVSNAHACIVGLALFVRPSRRHSSDLRFVSHVERPDADVDFEVVVLVEVRLATELVERRALVECSEHVWRLRAVVLRVVALRSYSTVNVKPKPSLQSSLLTSCSKLTVCWSNLSVSLNRLLSAVSLCRCVETWRGEGTCSIQRHVCTSRSNDRVYLDNQTHTQTMFSSAASSASTNVFETSSFAVRTLSIESTKIGDFSKNPLFKTLVFNKYLFMA